MAKTSDTMESLLSAQIKQFNERKKFKHDASLPFQFEETDEFDQNVSGDELDVSDTDTIEEDLLQNNSYSPSSPESLPISIAGSPLMAKTPLSPIDQLTQDTEKYITKLIEAVNQAIPLLREVDQLRKSEGLPPQFGQQIKQLDAMKHAQQHTQMGSFFAKKEDEFYVGTPLCVIESKEIARQKHAEKCNNEGSFLDRIFYKDEDKKEVVHTTPQPKRRHPSTHAEREEQRRNLSQSTSNIHDF